MTDYSNKFYDNAVRSEVQTAIVNSKANACPMAVRLAWHASGTFKTIYKHVIHMCRELKF